MQRAHISQHRPGFPQRAGSLMRLTALGMLAGFMLFFHAGEGLASPGAHKAGHQAHATADDRFNAMDRNGDGKVTIEEFQAAQPGMSERAFAVIDTNGDGAIERAEWVSFMQGHAAGARPQGLGNMPPNMPPNMPMTPPETAPRLNNIPGDPLIPPPDSADLPLMRPPSN